MKDLSNGAKVREKAVLGERMAEFKADLAARKKELEDLWEEHAAVEREILRLGIEVLGVKAMNLSKEDLESLELGIFLPESGGTEKEANAQEWKDLEAEVKRAGARAINEMLDCERVCLRCVFGLIVGKRLRLMYGMCAQMQASKKQEKDKKMAKMLALLDSDE